MDIIPIRALTDNYVWALLDTSTQKAFVVDPGDAYPVIETLNRLEYTLAGMLITHHHSDHTAGIDELLDYAGNIPVIASYKSTIPTVNHHVKENDDIQYLSFHLKAMEIPGHTLDHTAYHNHELIFTGDTLFSAGCGRIFEGTPEMMLASLNKIMQLNDHTKMYCGHEYTLANLKFAQVVEPSNHDITAKIKQCSDCTLPSLLRDEKTFNPFLRYNHPSVIQAAETYVGKKLLTALDVFSTLRVWKNGYRA